MTRLTASVFFFCLLVSSGWANGIKHPSDYGSPPSPITFPSCGSVTQNGVVGSCFGGTGPGFNDFLFTFALQTPSASTDITSVTLDFDFSPSDLSPDPVGLLEGTTTDCEAMNIACTPPQVTVSPLALVDGSNKFTFTNFTGDLTVTEYFSFNDTVTAPTFTGATTSSTTATPEPSEIGLLIAAFGSVIALRRRRQAKQSS